MKSLTDLFDINHGNKLDLNKMKLLPADEGGVNFVGRSSRKRGVTATVAPIADLDPYPAELITVPLGGTKLLACFVQERPFYTAQNIDVLTPKRPMTFAEKVYACLCIRHNRFKYGAFGREANRTLHLLEIPDPTNGAERPSWLAAASRDVEANTAAPATPKVPPALDTASWKPFKLSDLFEIKGGQGLVKHKRQPGETPYIGALDRNNGLVEYVSQPPSHPAGTLTLNYNGVGGVGVAFYQPTAYWCSGDVKALYPRFAMTAAVAMFLTAIIRKERYRYSFGRKWTLGRMAASEIRLPATEEGRPDWSFMEMYIKSLPYSSQL